MTLDFSKLKFSTKGLIAFLLGLGSLLQIPAIGNPVMAFGQHHPHVATIIGALTGIITLLHNPTVEAFLGIKQTTTTETPTATSTTTTIITAQPVDVAREIAK